MIRKDKICEFTDQDKQNLVVRKYSSDEMESNITAYKQKNNKRRIVLLTLFGASLLIAVTVKSDIPSFAGYISSVIVLFIFLIYEILTKLNTPLTGSEYFVEFVVDEKLDVDVSTFRSLYFLAIFDSMNVKDRGFERERTMICQEQ